MRIFHKPLSRLGEKSKKKNEFGGKFLFRQQILLINRNRILTVFFRINFFGEKIVKGGEQGKRVQVKI